MSDEDKIGSKHAEELRVIRIVQRATGQSIQNIRSALRTEQRHQDFQKIRLPEIPILKKEPPKIDVSSVSTTPTKVRPAAGGGTAGPSQAPASTPLPSGTVLTILLNSGVFEYWDLVGTYNSDV